ncbi:hypothetical protein V5F31_06540 [Xanthobacter sp. V7C-4]|uniref:hypothetical protein n=1 Tax=Xanthobacter autotrophicus (strain ATCC BAA-1158 / Py2) TaxID=78245 RepID=UPI00372948DE
MQLHLNSPRKARFRETETAYPGVLVQLGERARVAMCPDRLQYILQVRDGAAWRARRFFASRAALLTQLHEVVPGPRPVPCELRRVRKVTRQRWTPPVYGARLADLELPDLKAEPGAAPKPVEELVQFAEVADAAE